MSKEAKPVTEPVTEPVTPNTEPQDGTQATQTTAEVQTPTQPIDPVETLKSALQDTASEAYKMVMEIVAAEIKKRIAGATPKANTTAHNAEQVKAFRKMSYTEQLALSKADPTTYRELVELTKKSNY